MKTYTVSFWGAHEADTVSIEADQVEVYDGVLSFYRSLPEILHQDGENIWTERPRELVYARGAGEWVTVIEGEPDAQA